jgi:hypothetical protein
LQLAWGAGHWRSLKPDHVPRYPATCRVIRASMLVGDASTVQAGGKPVLLDPDQHRALVGTQTALRSTYAALMYLDGRYAPHFRKVDDRVGWRGQRVATWRIDWPED